MTASQLFDRVAAVTCVTAPTAVLILLGVDVHQALTDMPRPARVTGMSVPAGPVVTTRPRGTVDTGHRVR